MTKTEQVLADQVRPGDRVLIAGSYKIVTEYQGRERIQILADGTEIFGHAYGVECDEYDPYVDSVCLTEAFPATVLR